MIIGFDWKISMRALVDKPDTLAVMEPVTTGLIKTATKETAEALKKESESFLNCVYGEPAKALGGLFADKINRRRHANLIKITVEAKRKLAEAGVSPNEVPLSIIHPALEAASLEDNPDLQAMWASLIANAADPRFDNAVEPSFVSILRELIPRQAIFLDSFYEFTESARGHMPTLMSSIH